MIDIETGRRRTNVDLETGRRQPRDARPEIADPERHVIDRAHAPRGVRVAEVVLAMNPTLDGDGTALYLAEAVKPLGVRVTRLARGVPVGGQIEMTGRAVLADAIAGRTAMA